MDYPTKNEDFITNPTLDAEGYHIYLANDDDISF